MKTLEVGATNTYRVTVGKGARSMLAKELDASVSKVLIVCAGVMQKDAEKLRESLLDSFEVYIVELPDAEDAKRVEIAAFCWEILGQKDFTRSDAIVTLGGGSTTDLGGFVAATWLRGVKVVHLPTTVLAAVDAAIGGKTGINTTEGKNLVGAFHNPSAVLVDTDYLLTLPENELRSGFAEVAKSGFIKDVTILNDLNERIDEAINPETDLFVDLIHRAIVVKAEVVAEDFRETGQRETLNYGHTLGHAIEHAERYRWRHGAAISIGMIFAAELSRLTRSLTDAEVELHRTILGERLGLPIVYPADRFNALRKTMQRDKKARGSSLRFVLLDAIGRPIVSSVPDESIMFTAYSEIAD